MYLIYQVLYKGLSTEDFVLLFAAISGFSSWVTGLINGYTTLNYHSMNYGRFREFLEYKNKFLREEGEKVTYKKGEDYCIELRDVSFCYERQTEYILKDINPVIKPQEALAVVGLNGTGKTTLVKLLCGFCDPTMGQVLLNGKDIRIYNRLQYYKLFTCVFAFSLLVLFCLALIILSPYFTVLGERIWSRVSESNNKATRMSNFYFFTLTNSTNRAKDIRIYDQQHLISSGMKRDHSFFEKQTRYNARFNALSTGVSYLSNGLIYLFVALKALGGAFGIGNIVLYVGAINQFGNGLSFNVFLKATFAFLDIPNRKYQGTLHVEKREYEIEFHDVSFRYPDCDVYALKNLNMKIKVGRRMAVVGMNGSGKTTMIKLLCRLYDPTDGIITLNNMDIRKYNYNEYMKIFSVVFQDFKLLPFPLGENVAANTIVDREKVSTYLKRPVFKSVRTEWFMDWIPIFIRILKKKGWKFLAARRKKLHWPEHCIRNHHL